MEEALAQACVTQRWRFELATIGEQTGEALATVVFGDGAQSHVVELVVGEERWGVAQVATRNAVELHPAFSLILGHGARVTGNHLIPRALVWYQGAFVGGNRESNAFGGDGGGAECVLKQLRVSGVSQQRRNDIYRQVSGQRHRAHLRKLGRQHAPITIFVRHFGIAHRRPNGLAFQTATYSNADETSLRIYESAGAAAVPKRIWRIKRAKNIWRATPGELHIETKNWVGLIVADQIRADHTEGSEGVIGRLWNAVGTGAGAGAHVGVACSWDVTSCTCGGVVTGKLLFEEQDFAEHNLLRSNWVLRWNRWRRQWWRRATLREGGAGDSPDCDNQAE